MTTSGARQPRPGLRITLRDLSILEALHTTPYLRSDQIRRLFWREEKGGAWGRVKACQQRLALLLRHGYVRRIEQPVKRGEGSKHAIYALDRKGAALLVTELGVEPHEIEWKPRSQEEHFPFLEHLLATVDLRIALVEGCAHTGVTLEEWMDEKELKRAQNVDRVTLVSPQGSVVDAAVVPDAYFMLARAGKRGRFFVEVDLMTVTIAPSKWERRGWLRKVRAYAAYFQSEAFQRRYAGHPVRVLTVTRSPLRLAHLRTATEQVLAELRDAGEEATAQGAFWFGLLTPDLDGVDLLTAPRWSVAGLDMPRALLE